ncbi:uncharacterized protein LOC116131818 [Pistacia vera]|uniref:uncharacterized protein LOC116131818 n=1 Tax=Pistacia vera TaxID=55513 RepID=UPI001263CDC7|nr:uncharacterized protein LOC116131818 [Pistacia vera]
MDKGNSLSVLVDGCKLAKQLQTLNRGDGGRNSKWEVISEVWLEMLGHAASHCVWKEHGEQLMNGGELLASRRITVFEVFDLYDIFCDFPDIFRDFPDICRDFRNLCD